MNGSKTPIAKLKKQKMVPNASPLVEKLSYNIIRNVYYLTL